MCLFNSKKYPVLKLNDKDIAVLEAVKLLRNHGANIKGSLTYTIGVRSAVISFQKKHGLEPTGIIDKKTWKQLKKKPRVS